MNTNTRSLFALMTCCLAPICFVHSASSKADAAGPWTGVFMSGQNMVRITLQLPALDAQSASADNLDLRIEPLVESRMGGATMGIMHARVVYEPAVRSVVLTLGSDARVILGGRLQAFSGVLAPDGRLIAGSVIGVSGDDNPYFVMGRAEIADAAFVKKLKDAAFFTQNIPRPKISILKKFIDPTGSRKTDLSKSLQAWANHWSAEYPEVDAYNTAVGSLFLKARNLFRDESFHPYFGKNFDDLDADDLMDQFTAIQNVRPPQSNLPEEKANGVIVGVRHAFFTGPGYGNAADTRLSVIAQRIMSSWRTQALHNLQSVAVNADGWRFISGAEATEGPVFSLFYPSERREFVNAVSSARTKVAGPALTQQVDVVLASANAFEDLPKVRDALRDIGNRSNQAGTEASLASVAPFAPEDLRRGLTGRLESREADLVAADMTARVANAASAEDLDGLMLSQRSIPARISAASDAQRRASWTSLDSSLKSKIHEMLERFAGAETAEYRRTIEILLPGLRSLQQTREFEEGLPSRYSQKQLSSDEFSAFNQERTTFRRELLSKSSDAVIREAAVATTIKDVKGLSDQYVYQDDAKTEPALRIAAAVQQRIHPPGSLNTAGLSYADDLDNIDAGDFQSVRFARKSLESSSIVNQYMIAFAEQCEAYLPKNRVAIMTMKCNTWEPTFRNDVAVPGLERCATSIPVPSGLYADPEVYDVQQQVDIAEVGNIVGDMFKALSSPDAALKMVGNAISVVTKARSDMSALLSKNGCASAATKRFQSNLLRFGSGNEPLPIATKAVAVAGGH